MKNFILIAAILFLPQLLYSQDYSIIDGTWEGSIILQGQPLLITVTFNTMDGATDGSINIPQQSAFNLPVQVPVLTPDSLEFSFETGTGKATFSAGLTGREADTINGIFTQSGVELPFQMERSTDEDSTDTDYFSEQEVVITTDSLTIAGSLVVPDTMQTKSLVIFVSGSGSQTRNSSVAGFELFEEMADQLALHGISTFRYDDRGTGESTGSSDATLDELADDLESIAAHFSNGQSGNTFDSIVYLGHSQGGLISLLAAKEFTPHRVVLLATPTLPGDKIITQQIQNISEEQEIPEEVVTRNLEFQQKVYEAARTGEGWDELEADIEERLREQLDQLPESQRSTLGDMDQFIDAQVSRQLNGAKSDWFKSFIETDPAPLLRSLDVPTLAIFGENDSQVILEPNRDALEEINGNVTIHVIPNANHLFQVSESGMPGEYGILDKEFAPGLIDEIVEFLKKVE
ncbi:alpha/beta hydrolase [Rhodohalobacter sp. 8-1]|uniref:alpha/beta hydrolase n=1 Tax=Rhodohalobacter sp. 8-1 TaxID=3131972 RepID=UPI0030EB8851